MMIAAMIVLAAPVAAAFYFGYSIGWVRGHGVNVQPHERCWLTPMWKCETHSYRSESAEGPCRYFDDGWTRDRNKPCVITGDE